ncbi:MAG: hypothetical protein ACKOWJ_03300 [Micrococcales bacterium]
MISVNQSSIPDFLMAIAFVLLAVGIFVGTFYFGGAYVFSNIKERWHEYSVGKRIRVIANLVITFSVIALLWYLSTRKA